MRVLLFPRQEGKRRKWEGVRVPGGRSSVVAGEAADEDLAKGRRARGSPSRRRQPPLEEEERASESEREKGGKNKKEREERARTHKNPQPLPHSGSHSGSGVWEWQRTEFSPSGPPTPRSTATDYKTPSNFSY